MAKQLISKATKDEKHNAVFGKLHPTPKGVKAEKSAEKKAMRMYGTKLSCEKKAK